ncbi:MAG: AAA family ATPase, partial [Thermoguttaceae bacterium]
MPMIEGFRVRNYRVLRDIVIGAIKTDPRFANVEYDDDVYPQRPQPLTPLTVVIGKNGFGKSTLFDAFGFIVDSLKFGVETACKKRGGFSRIVSHGSDGLLQFEVQYGEILYSLIITADEYGVPFVFSETLSHLDPDPEEHDLMNFFMKGGKGKVIHLKTHTVTDVNLTDNRILALASLGNFSDYPDIVSFRDYLSGWYLCFFSPNAARGLPPSGPQQHLSSRGENLANVVQYLQREHPVLFQNIIERVSKKIPGISKIWTTVTEDSRLLL